MPTIDDFEALGVMAGRVIDCQPNAKARVPAYVLRINFGEHGIKTSSAQITDLYTPKDLVGRTVVAVTGFPPRNIAGVESDVLVLGFHGEAGVVLIGPDHDVAPGARLG